METTSRGPPGPLHSAKERARGNTFSETFWVSAQRRGTATPEGCSGKAARALGAQSVEDCGRRHGEHRGLPEW